MTIMVWKTDAFGSIRVTVEAVSVSGLSTLVRITRNEKYRPALLPEELWVMTSNLHKPIQRKRAEDATDAEMVKGVNISLKRKANALAAAERTAETLKGKMPAKRAPKVETF